MDERFWAKVDRRGDDECWEWTAYRNRTGYGHFRVRREVLRAHRVAYELMHGPIPDGLHVLHHCDNPPCCNPAHLRLGTAADNKADAVARGRHARWENSGGDRKLTIRQVGDIRAAVPSGHFVRGQRKRLAERYGVSTRTIYDIVRGHAWKGSEIGIG